MTEQELIWAANKILRSDFKTLSDLDRHLTESESSRKTLALFGIHFESAPVELPRKLGQR